MAQWRNKYGAIILSFLIIISFIVADGAHIINFPPWSVHQWRQGDCFAYARNYYERNTGFFSPSFYNLVVKDGKTTSEFPILYYIGAKLFYIFGIQYWILRGLTFLCSIIGLFYLYACARFWIKESLLAIFPVILLATTPFYYYYALNYLPNVPAISLSFCGFYYLILYKQTTIKKYLFIGSVVFILAMLFKPPDGGLLFCAFFATEGIELLTGKLKDKKLLPYIISIIFVAIGVISWILYARWYNAVNNSTLNLLGIYPIWDMNIGEVKYVFRWKIGDFWLNSYQQRYILYFIALLLILYFVKWRSLDSYLRKVTLFLVIGTIIYDILWFKAFANHDYYQLTNVIAPVFLIITVLQYYEIKLVVMLNKWVKAIVITGLFIILFVSIYHNRRVQIDRYYNPYYTGRTRAIYEIEPYLRKWGISAKDRVISIPDNTPNVTLAAFGNRGYTNLFENPDLNVAHIKNHDAQYLIITDTGYLHRQVYAPYVSKLLGVYKDVYVFDVR